MGAGQQGDNYSVQSNEMKQGNEIKSVYKHERNEEKVVLLDQWLVSRAATALARHL
jgi:hypothetical protein